MELGLTKDKTIFAEAVLAGEKKGKAYQLAFNRPKDGQYERQRGALLVRDESVKTYIKERKADILKALKVTSEGILAAIHDLSTNARSENVKLQALIALGKHKRLFSDETAVAAAAGGALAPINIQIFTMKDPSKDRIRVWTEMSGERHTPIQLHAETVPGTNVVGLSEQSHPDDPSGSPSMREGSGHVEQGNL